MPCYSPLRGFTGAPDGSGKVRVHWSPSNAAKTHLELPCGKCIGCRLERSRQWAVRLMHEAQMHELSTFVTLTYAPDKLPSGGTLVPDHLRLFMRNLRHASTAPVRFFACGEYGEELSRPHYHAILFGVDFPDKVKLRETPRGDPLYRSALLERLWPHGFSTIGAVSFESARYVAAYCVKKIGGKKADEHYRRVDLETGEVYQLHPEFIRMSRRPGIGSTWFDKFGADVYPSDEVITQTRAAKPPRYYDKKLKAADPETAAAITKKRVERANTRFDETMPARLRVREQVTKARFNLRKRELSK